MTEEVWSGSSLGSSCLNEDEELSNLADTDPTQQSHEHAESYQLRSTNVDREVLNVTQKYLSRRAAELSTVGTVKKSSVLVSSFGEDLGVDKHDFSFDRSSSPSNYHQAQHHSHHEEGEISDEPQFMLADSMEYHDSPQSSEGSHDMMELLLPSFTRFNKLLNENGCLTMSVAAADLDINSRSISVFVLDSWAESASSFVAEMIEHRQRSREKVADASFEVSKSDISMSNLDVEIHHLRERLETARAKEKELKMKSEQSDELIEKLQKHMEELKADHSRKLKLSENISEEKDRKLRINELEANKMREKLRQLTTKERSSASKAADTLKSYQRGAEVVANSPSSPLKGGKRSLGSSGDSVVSIDDVLQAMEAEQVKLRTQNEELEKQVESLTKRLKKSMNDKEDTAEAGVRSKKFLSLASSSSLKDHPSDDVDASGDVHVLSDKVKGQSQRIRQLQHQLEAEAATVKTQGEDMKVLRQRAGEMREEIHNLRLEIDSRPTMSQWKSKAKEVSLLESKLHDVVMMKGEAAELMNWRQHLSTADRIKADRRNHELKLWLLESLPKSVMQEVLQGLCRELDVSDVSELHPGIVKMKAVIRAVPRMEQFITSVCNFVFQKDRPRHPEGDINTRPAMEDALPILKRWWSDCYSAKKYTKFQQDVTLELMRMEGATTGTSPPTHASVLDRPGDFQKNIDMRGGQRPAKWTGEGAETGLEVSALQKIKSLVDFQVELFRSSKSFVDAQSFISERPEVLVNSLIEHIRYLFGVKTLQGMIPRMNEVYLFSEEMCNFINNARQMMKMSNLPDATVLTEIYRRIKSAERVKKVGRDSDDDPADSADDSSTISKFIDDASEDFLGDS